jgi:hypothetical protein
LKSLSLSTSNNRLTRASSSTAVNLWPLARVSDRGFIPFSWFRRVASDTLKIAAARRFDEIFLFEWLT